MMLAFLLDTNVLSELMRAQPELKVITWFEKHIDARCFTSSITKAEVFLGIALLRDDARRANLENKAEKIFSQDFYDRCLPFDDQSAMVYAKLVSHRRVTGKPISTEDAQIAAIALTNNLTLVTRNTKDFVEINKLTVVNPWETP